MTIHTATEYLKTFFAKVPGDFVTLEEVFSSYGRNLEEQARNKMWLGNKLTPIKRYRLVTSVYKTGLLVGLRLTKDGKIALGRVVDGNTTPTEPQRETKNSHVHISLEDVLSGIAKFKHDNPDLKVTFSITPKEE